MNKKTAIELVVGRGTPVNSKNAAFSNENEAKPVWWLTIDNNKFESPLYFILNNDAKKELCVLLLPAATFPNPKQALYQRHDKNSSHVEIKVNGDVFIDEKSGIDFTKFFIQRIPYN